MNAYLISGIGADYRLFTHIVLPPGYEVRHIHWIAPEKEESLPAYACRLAGQIDLKTPFILIGFSLGGIMATEIANRCHPVRTIIISSVPISSQLPPYYRHAHRLRLSKLVTPQVMKFFASAKFRLTMRRGNRKIMREVIRAGDNRFITWAMHAVLDWRNETIPGSLVHIHGAWDEIFPVRWTRPTFTIPKAGHNLVLRRAAEVNRLLREILPSGGQ
ncbi:MAG TPA: alpha/beta hydrolase [Puia sp.]|nr:alpha/beta hydrolase [Puia sp.]